MPDELDPAVAVLRRKLDEQLQAVSDTKRTINMLMKMSGKDPLYPEDDSEKGGVIRDDQFYGKGLATSAAEYLALRHQACKPEDIFRALRDGGFDFDLQGWQGDDALKIRSLAMSLAKNTGGAGKFHRLKNGSFGLRTWYDPSFLKKVAAGPEVQRKPRKRVARKPIKASKNRTEPRAPKAGTKEPEGLKTVA